MINYLISLNLEAADKNLNFGGSEFELRKQGQKQLNFLQILQKFGVNHHGKFGYIL